MPATSRVTLRELNSSWDPAYKEAFSKAAKYRALDSRRVYSVISLHDEPHLEGQAPEKCSDEAKCWRDTSDPIAEGKSFCGSRELHDWLKEPFMSSESSVIVWKSESEKQQVLEERFRELSEKWRDETGAFSSATKKVMNFHYLRIVGMGMPVVPVILRELQRRPSHWFQALTFITGEDPVKPEEKGDISRMAEAWIRLGKQRGWLDEESKT